MRVLAATAPDVACLHSESSTVAPWCFGACPNSLSHRSKDLLHHARARSLTSESSGHGVVRSLRFQSLKVWPFKKLILVLAELLGLYGQPEPAGPASTCLAVAGSDAALLGGRRIAWLSHQTARAQATPAWASDVALRQRGIAVLQRSRTISPEQSRS